MKRLILLLTVVLIPILSQRQEEKTDKKGWIGFSMGTAVPVGEFGLEDGGNAGTGFQYTIINI